MQFICTICPSVSTFSLPADTETHRRALGCALRHIVGNVSVSETGVKPKLIQTGIEVTLQTPVVMM